jgi:hypothetical protein
MGGSSTELREIGAGKKSAGAPEEIEVTPAMVEAGAASVWEWFYDVVPFDSDIGREVAKRVYSAMAAARI